MKKINILITWHKMVSFLKENKKLKKKNIIYDFITAKQSLNEKKLSKIIHKYDGVICGDDEFNKNVIKKAKKLKVISKWGTGIDSIDKIYANKKKIKVYNTPGAFTNSVADIAIAFILNIARKIYQTDKEIRKNNWPKFTGQSLNEKTLGIIGFGRIGKRLSKIALFFGMKIIFFDIKKIKTNKKCSQVSIKSLFKKSDFITICCDLNPTSENLVRLKYLKLMKKTSSLINVSRGPIVNEAELIYALNKGIINFACLDVFEKEPLDKKNKLLKMNNCILSSHNAFNSREAVNKVNINTLNNLYRGLNI